MATTCTSTLVLLLCCLSFSEAREYLVGGTTDAWKIPTNSQSDSLNQWAESNRFLVGDSIEWKYDSNKDSVLQVNKEAYLNCNTTSPIEEYKDGNTTVKLNKSGPYYFISGASGHCEKGQKLVVVVISARHNRYNMGISPAPSPTAEFDGPAVAPTSGGSSLKGGLLLVWGFLGFVWIM